MKLKAGHAEFLNPHSGASFPGLVSFPLKAAAAASVLAGVLVQNHRKTLNSDVGSQGCHPTPKNSTPPPPPFPKPKESRGARLRHRKGRGAGGGRFQAVCICVTGPGFSFPLVRLAVSW